MHWTKKDQTTCEFDSAKIEDIFPRQKKGKQTNRGTMHPVFIECNILMGIPLR